MTGVPMPKYKVGCLDVFAPKVQRAIRDVARSDFEIHFAQSYDVDEQLDLATDADFILVGGATLSAAMIEKAVGLRLIQKWGVGVDKIDLDAARRLEIPVAITSGGNAGPVAELAVGLMLAVYRRIAWADRRMREGVWGEIRDACVVLPDRGENHRSVRIRSDRADDSPSFVRL